MLKAGTSLSMKIFCQSTRLILSEYAKAKEATNAQISIAWMLHKYPYLVPIQVLKSERILEI